MPYGPYEQIAVAVEDGILTLTLNRPDKLNAFTAKMMSEMIDVFVKVNADDAVGAVIVTGAGRAFCAGADLSAGAATFDATTNPARRERDAGPVEDGGLERRARARRRRAGDARHLRMPEARDRGGERRRGRHRRDDAACDGHPHRRPRRALRLRLRAPRHRAGGGVELVPAAAGRHLQGARMVLFRSRLRRRGGARRRPRLRGRRRGGAPVARPRHRARDRRQHRAGLHRADPPDDVGAAWAWTTRWRRTRSTPAASMPAAPPPTCAKASARSSRSARRNSR